MTDPGQLDDSVSTRDLLHQIRKELVTIRQQMTQAIYAMGQAEKEIPEWMRRFGNYFHDVVHIREAYIQLGLPVPSWLNHEIERCHDRMNQSLNDLHTDGGAFEKVRRDMVNHPVKPHFDHTRQLPNLNSKNGAAK